MPPRAISPTRLISAGEIAVQAEVVLVYRRVNMGLSLLTDRLCALEPNVLVSLMGLTCLWVIWTIYVWMQNPFVR